MSIDEIINELDRLRFILERKRDREKTGTGIWQTSNDRVVALSETISLLRTHPDSQPNKPLTLEELRNMDGQPVWIDRGPGYGVGWVLVQVWAKSTNIIYLIRANGSVLQLGVEIKNGAKLYRRPPKESTNER